MKLIDGDALAARIRNDRAVIIRAARFMKDESYECGAVDAFTDVLSYIEEAPELGQQLAGRDETDPGQQPEPEGDPEREVPAGSDKGNRIRRRGIRR